MIKKIGITQRVHTICEYQEHRDELDQNWSRLLNEIGILQIILPNNKDIITNRIIDNYDLDGVILTGGEIKNNDSKVSIELKDLDKLAYEDYEFSILGESSSSSNTNYFKLKKVVKFTLLPRKILFFLKLSTNLKLKSFCSISWRIIKD